MSNFPTALDDDGSIYRIDDNISELGTDVINQLRSAVFSIEQNLGLSAAGSLSSLSDRLNISLNPDGTIKASALTSIGLVTLPITNAQVGTNAGILESKLSLDYSTSNLNTLIQANTVLLNSLVAYEAALETKVNSHISGGPASNLRHTASMIDINAVPSDSRDPGYNWTGLIDKDGYDLSATNVSDALFEINTNLTNHQNQEVAAHKASAISVDTSGFHELLESSTDVQSALQNIDNIELLQLGTHREVHHSNGVPNRALALNLNSLTTIGSDGYNIQVIGSTPIIAHVAHAPPGTNPLDNVINGDSIISFIPASNTGAVFDAQFSQVKFGDIIRINYGNGIEDLRRVESIKYIPGTTWIVRINGVNLRDTDGYTTYARIDRPLFDTNTSGVLAVAAANAVPLIDYSIMGSVVVSDPRGATAIGYNFNPAKINKNNYLLYLQLYPNGNPSDHVISLPGIDVSGDLGQSSGKYTLESIIQATNNSFRKTGYNYRFIAHEVEGNFAISLADSIDGAAFSIVNGSNSTGSLIESTFVHNVIGDAVEPGQDALGLGLANANLASPAYQATWIDATAAQIPTKIIHPVKSRNYIVNGRPFDTFKSKPLTTNGFWAAEIDSRTVVGNSVEVTYKINKILNTAGLKTGKTIVVQPAVSFSDGLYNDVDYGRFIIKSVIFNPCECLDEYTLITVINGIHGTSNPLSSSGAHGLPVRLYFSEDSVSFDDQNIIDVSESGINYHRFFEIYITDSKTTFSHERARMPYQSATGFLLATNFFHIDSVSPKFRGYREGSILNKYIRFYVLNYNATTGEYDGYLGQRNSSNYTISKTGPIVRGKKNVKTRFYDDTNVDYIDLTFVDESINLPGTSVTINPAYVDIELFDSLEYDGELLLLASCEVNWNPEAGANVVDKVVNKKQFGSISELEFTQTAKNYITSGERYLHGNGIIKGFDVGINGDVSGSNAFIVNGGMALVNGKFAISNTTTIKIPNITNNGPAPQTLNWILCINETGNLIVLPLTETKIEFIAYNNDSALSYYINSVIFAELINRKDLTPLYIYNVSIAASVFTLSVNNITDVRRYVKNETSLIPLVWSGKDFTDSDIFDSTSEITGHFHKIEQVVSWINWTKSTSNVIKIKGNIILNESLDLRSLKYPVVFDGIEGGLITVKAARGLILLENTQLKNISFNWLLPGLGYASASDNVNIDTSGTPTFNSSNALIYVYNDNSNGNGDTGNFLKNITIDNCKFTGTFPQTQRPPFIAFILGNLGSVFDNIRVTNNIFTDTINNQCAVIIACLHTNPGNTQVFTSAKNIFIENNSANNNQSILVTVLAASLVAGSRFLCSNVNIAKNLVGSIGCIMSSYLGDFTFIDNENVTNGINVYNNSATFIGTLDSTGHLPDENVFSANAIGSGDIRISNNNCSIIVCDFYPNNDFIGVPDLAQSLLISDNKIRVKQDYSTISNIYSLENSYFAIRVRGWVNRTTAIGSFTLLNDERSVQIVNNYITYNINTLVVVGMYDIAINVDSCGGIISGNVIKGFNSIGISCFNNVNRDRPVKLDIVNNQLYNPIDTADNYIYVTNGVETNAYMYTIINNSFDRYQTNGSVDNMIYSGNFESQRIIKDNINQTDYAHLRAANIGKIILDVYEPGFNPSPFVGPNSIAYYSTGGMISGSLSQLTVICPDTSSGFSWLVPLSLFNPNIKFISARIYYTQFGDPSNSNTVRLILRASDPAINGISTDSDSILDSALNVVTDNNRNFIEINAPTNSFFHPATGLVLEVQFIIGSGTGNRKISFEPLKYTFRY